MKERILHTFYTHEKIQFSAPATKIAIFG